MRNKIEILRSLCFSKEDMTKIKNLGDQFKEIEIDFMINFKKIYELGLNQLEKFINKLDEEGKELEPWDIEYYVKSLLNGPLKKYVLILAQDKKYFEIIPDVLGIFGNNQSSRHNTSLYEDDLIPLEVPVDVYNKSPDFIQNLITKAQEQVDNVFRSSLKMVTTHDNTLPIIDKRPQDRYGEEREGKWVLKSNGSFCVKDVFYRKNMEDARQKIFDKVKEFIGEEHYRIFEDKKSYSPFDSEKNTSKALPIIVEKAVTEGDREEIFKMDVFGDVYDEWDTVLKIETPEKNREYKLNTVEGNFNV